MAEQDSGTTWNRGTVRAMVFRKVGETLGVCIETLAESTHLTDDFSIRDDEVGTLRERCESGFNITIAIDDESHFRGSLGDLIGCLVERKRACDADTAPE